MLGIKGAFVVVGVTDVAPFLIDARQVGLYQDRVAVVGAEKANRATFGLDAVYALPCTPECMQALALSYEGLHQPLVRKLCALVALGRPIPNDWRGQPGPHGGERVEQHPKPPTRPPSGKTVSPWGEVPVVSEATISF